MASSSKPAKSNSRVFDYQPKSEWFEDEENKVLQIEVPEFKREELKVQIENSGSLKVSGQRRIDSTKSSRFEESFPTPDGIIRSSIKAKFENGVLHVIMPFKHPPKMPPLTPEEDFPATGETQKEARNDKSRFLVGTRKKRIVLAYVGLAVVATVLGLYVSYRCGDSVGEWNCWKKSIFVLENIPSFRGV